MRWFLDFCLGLLVLFLVQNGALADRRVALVIGNGTYTHAPHLPNATHDAEGVAAALKQSNFEVIQGIDLDQAGMKDAVVRFAGAAQSADIGIFYYSGHAMQFNGINYLMPVDTKLSDEADLYRFTRVDDVLGYLQQAKNLKILVLDSCRDNPLADNFKRSIGRTRAIPMSRGLAKIEAPLGTIIAFSTQAGQEAEDGGGRNSPYTAAFLRHIGEPNEIGDIFRDISADVYRATNDRQLPELSLSVIGKFYLQERLPGNPCAAAETHWKAADVIGTIEAYEDHLARFRNCVFAGLANARIEVLRKKEAAEAHPDVKRFDGFWVTNVVCDGKGDVGGYAGKFIGRMKNSVFHGQWGVPGQPGWATWDGTIETDGTIELLQKGLTGDPKDTLDHPPPGKEYSAPYTGRFDGSHGSAIRIEGRTCHMDFVKQ